MQVTQDFKPDGHDVVDLHQCEAMLTAGFRGRTAVIVNTLQSALLLTCVATVTLVHAYDGMLSNVSRTVGQIALLLHAECSAEQAPVLDTDMHPNSKFIHHEGDDSMI